MKQVNSLCVYSQVKAAGICPLLGFIGKYDEHNTICFCRVVIMILANFQGQNLFSSSLW